ncbi:MMEL1 [Lepeophtheirus salmonis]|uniref:MMEL1 n=2 Tax=Lepeophtheirus salmonis TaxID=72036 RepID=A0A7R8H644_LEPSM|nr:MMEL1 [Lepeophtheirus salmonis]CAF2874855.1 MMEL1 [Lepeophtheirus salmonis]
MKWTFWIPFLVLHFEHSLEEEIEKKSSHQSSCEPQDSLKRKVCLSEDCVKAAATILFSLDRSVDPCEDFYQYACGGWATRTIIQNTDRFQMVDKRNQLFIHNLLTEMNENEDEAVAKVKKYYQVCISEDEKRNLPYLQSLIDYTGGWTLTGNKGIIPEIDMNTRLQILQNEFGLNVFFTWGVVEHKSKHKLALFAGGWNDAFIETDRDDYLKLMTVFTLYLSQATETHDVVLEDEDVTTNSDLEEDDVNVQYTYNVDFGLDENETIANDSSIDISYDYEDIIPENESNNSASPNFFDWLDWFHKGYHVTEEDNEVSQENLPPTSSSSNHSPPIPTEETHPSKVKSERILQNIETIVKMQDQEDSSMFGISNSISVAMNEVINFEEKLANITTGKIVDLKDLTSMSGVSKLVSSTSQAELINYMTWRLLAAFYPNRPRDESQRREQCLAETEDVFAPVVTSLYVKAKKT